MKELREQIAATLMHAAQAILDGAPLEGFEWLAKSDGFNSDTLDIARGEATRDCVMSPYDDVWPEFTDEVSWGIYVPVERAAQTNRIETPDHPEHDWTCGYELRPTLVQSDRLVTIRGDDITAPLPGAQTWVDLLDLSSTDGPAKPPEELESVAVDPRHVPRIMCPECKGTGEIVDGNHSGHAGYAIWVCPRCDGTRRVLA